jgi:hypothetical protein
MRNGSLLCVNLMLAVQRTQKLWNSGPQDEEGRAWETGLCNPIVADSWLAGLLMKRVRDVVLALFRTHRKVSVRELKTSTHTHHASYRMSGTRLSEERVTATDGCLMAFDPSIDRYYLGVKYCLAPGHAVTCSRHFRGFSTVVPPVREKRSGVLIGAKCAASATKTGPYFLIIIP